jgi:hypothetical protein
MRTHTMIHLFDGQKVECGARAPAQEWSVQPVRIECLARRACIARDPYRPEVAHEAMLPVLVGNPVTRG